MTKQSQKNLNSGQIVTIIECMCSLLEFFGYWPSRDLAIAFILLKSILRRWVFGEGLRLGYQMNTTPLYPSCIGL